MYRINDETRNIFYSCGADYKAIIKINGEEISERQISKITLSNPLFDITSQTFNLGQFVSQQLELYFKDTSNISLTGELEFTIGVRKDTVQSDYTLIPIGKFIIDTSDEDYYKNKKITCLDYAIKMKQNVDYSSLVVDEDGNVTPITLETLLIWLCNHFNIELGNYPNTNKDYLISTYDSTKSGKYYVSQIAELMGGNAIIDRDGKLNIIPLKQDIAITRDATKNETWEYTNKYEISAVEYNNGVLYKRCGNDDGNTLFVRSDNMFILDNYETLIENIYDAVKDTTICSLKTKQPCDLSLDRWDLIEFDLDGETYITYNNNNITYEMSIVAEINTQIPNKTQEQTTNQIKGSDNDKIRKIQIEIDQQKLSINQVIEEIDDITSKQVSISQDVNGLTTQVTTTNNSIVEMNEKIGELENQTSEIQTIKNTVETLEDDSKILLDFKNDVTVNGVTKVHTETNYVFDKDGLVINESDENVSSRLNNKGLAIFDGEIKDNLDDAILYAGYDSKYSSSVLKTQKMIINDKLRFENYVNERNEEAVGCFWVGN